MTAVSKVARGEVRNKKYMGRALLFKGIRFGNITPTDVDGLIEYKNKAWILIEAKYQDAELPFGQRLAIERAIDDWSKHKPSIGLVCSFENTEGDIIVADCNVTEFRMKGTWRTPKKPITVLSAVETFLETVA